MIDRYDTKKDRHWYFSYVAWKYLWFPVLLISLCHYATGSTYDWLHDILRRLYYLPIVFAAFIFGRKGALMIALIISLIYVPHAFLSFFEGDPASTAQKVLEILLYNILAFIAGTLADQRHATACRLEKTIKENKVMEKELVRSGRLQALGELTAGLTQEIKRPLSSLRKTIVEIANYLPQGSPQQTSISKMRREFERLERLLDKFLSFAKPMHFDVSQLSLHKLIAHTIQVVDSQASHLGKKIDWEPPSSEVEVIGDREKLVQVVCNLLLNAIQATQKDGVVQIRCGRTSRSEIVYGYVEIKDEGSGIQQEDVEKIFNPFFTTKKGGTGLGLSIANRIVDEHGGFIEVENTPSGGALFRVLLQTTDRRVADRLS